jgi:hypothetical protein
MTEDKDVRISIVECPNGHRMRLEIVLNTPNLIQMVKCPVCGVTRVGLLREVRSVTSDNSEEQ